MSQRIFAKGIVLAELRIRKGYSLTQLAKTVKVTKSTLCRIVNGKQSTSPIMAKRICQALGTEDFDQLFEIVSE